MGDANLDAVTTTMPLQGFTEGEVPGAQAPEADTPDLQRDDQTGAKDIAKGPPSVGGLGRPVKGCRAESNGASQTLISKWEQETVDRLAELLSCSVLANLLGPLLQTLRRARRVKTGSSRRETKRELATALVLQHGMDLFGDRRVRKAVARAARMLAPVKWYAGKRAAVEFVVAAGFPRELAGIPATGSKPSFEVLQGGFRLAPLLDYQKEAKLAVDRTLRLPSGARLALPSDRWRQDAHHRREFPRLGGGALPGHEPRRQRPHPGLDCPHRRALRTGLRLLRSTLEGLQQRRTLDPARFWGAHTKDLARLRRASEETPGRACVLITTPQRMLNLLGGRIEARPEFVQWLMSNRLRVVVDEAHRGAAPSFRQIIESLSTPDRPVSVIGLTATPFREVYHGRESPGGTADLREIFLTLIEAGEALGANPRATLQDMGVLARPIFSVLPTNLSIWLRDLPDLQHLTNEDMERLDRQLAIQADNTLRRLAIVDHLLPIAERPSIRSCITARASGMPNAWPSSCDSTGSRRPWSAARHATGPGGGSCRTLSGRAFGCFATARC